jgi:hypothetical protein
MKHSKIKGNFFAVALMAILLALSVPATSLAMDRDHGRDNRDNRSWSKHNRKCGKFVNCHDARDGKWDRRGARGDRVGNVVWRNRNRNRVGVNDNFLHRRYLPRRIRVNHWWMLHSAWVVNEPELDGFLTLIWRVRIMNSPHGDVAELADAQVSEACDGDIVEVQVLSSPPNSSELESEPVNKGSLFFVLVVGPAFLPVGY